MSANNTFTGYRELHNDTYASVFIKALGWEHVKCTLLTIVDRDEGL